MFIDYVSLMLLNAMAGLFLLARYVLSGMEDADQTRWAPGFLMVGVIGAVFGGIMAMTWPIIGPYGKAYGEMSTLLGIVYLGAGVAMAKGWSLRTVTCYAFFAGWAAVVLGVRIIQLKLTLTPVPSGIAFILSGFAGVMAWPTLVYMKNSVTIRALGVLVILVAAVLWGTIVYAEYWHQMASFDKWVPLIMRPR